MTQPQWREGESNISIPSKCIGALWVFWGGKKMYDLKDQVYHQSRPVNSGGS